MSGARRSHVCTRLEEPIAAVVDALGLFCRPQAVPVVWPDDIGDAGLLGAVEVGLRRDGVVGAEEVKLIVVLVVLPRERALVDELMAIGAPQN